MTITDNSGFRFPDLDAGIWGCINGYETDLKEVWEDPEQGAKVLTIASVIADWFVTASESLVDDPNKATEVREGLSRLGLSAPVLLASEMTQDEQTRLIESLEAPRSMRDERALRKLMKETPGEGEQASREIARFVGERGLQPWHAPEPLPPIEEEDVYLVVWMGVEALENIS